MLDAPCSRLARHCCFSVLCMTLLLFVRHYCAFVLVQCSLFDIIVQHCCSSRPCSTFLLLLSLLNVIILCSLLNVVAPSLLSQCCYSSCPYSTLLFFHSLLDVIVIVCFFNACPPFSLLDTTPLVIARHYCSLFLVFPFSLLDIVAFVLFVRLYYSSILA